MIVEDCGCGDYDIRWEDTGDGVWFTHDAKNGAVVNLNEKDNKVILQLGPNGDTELEIPVTQQGARKTAEACARLMNGNESNSEER